jgi:hypothetical protein
MQMRKSIVAVALVTGLQVFASHASATDRPSAMTGPHTTTEMGSVNVARARGAVDVDQSEIQASLSNAAERKQYEGQAQVESKNFASPKPLRIYFFFGGR